MFLGGCFCLCICFGILGVFFFLWCCGLVILFVWYGIVIKIFVLYGFVSV